MSMYVSHSCVVSDAGSESLIFWMTSINSDITGLSLEMSSGVSSEFSIKASKYSIAASIA